MKITIRNRWTGEPIYTAKDVENLCQALTEAVTGGKSLSGANLSRANLYGADLSRANNISKFMTSPMYMLLDQVGEIRAYKLVDEDYTGPWHHTITYKVGESYEEPNFCGDENEQCAAGINLASLDWCLKEWKPGYHILVASFERMHGDLDNICIPIGSDGKFRVRKCTMVDEIDLVKLGIITEEKVEEATKEDQEFTAKEEDDQP